MSSPIGKAAVIVVLLAAIVGVLYVKGQQSARRTAAVTPAAPAVTPAPPTASAPAPETAAPKSAKASSPTPDMKTESSKKSAKQTTTRQTSSAAQPTKVVPVKPAQLPRLLELGADKCVPCKMMQPVLDGLRKDYAGKLQVDFIDVWKDPSVGEQYGIQAIPTQIFFNADGEEIFRHTGFYPKEDILAKFAEFGVIH
ncbi:MAG: thioredoxin family protein [Armatimonadota bacterium]